MNTILINSKIEIENNRFKLLKYSFIFSIISSLFSLLFDSSGVSIAILLIVNLLFQFGINYLIDKCTKHEKYSFKSIVDIMDFKKEILILSFFYLLFIVFEISLLKLLIKLKYIIFFIPVLVFVSILVINCINHLVLFSIFEKKESIVKSFKIAVRLFFKSRKIFSHILLKTILIILVGNLLVYAINIFAYAPQIDYILKTSEVINDSLFNPIFTTKLSYLIQSVGMQMIISYISIVSGITYRVYYLKSNHIIIKK